MEKDFQDIQQLDSEENDHQPSGNEEQGTHGQNPRTENRFWKGQPPSPPFAQRLGSRLLLHLLALAFNVLLLVVICVISSQSIQLQGELRTLKESFNNFSSSTLMEFGVLDSHGSRDDILTSWEAKLEKKQQDLKADHATLLLHLKHFPLDLKILTCQLAFFQSNGTECCPVNWLDHGGSCYWFSRGGLTWDEADKYCQLENAHLVVINSWEEQSETLHTPSDGMIRVCAGQADSVYFIEPELRCKAHRLVHTWIGLTDKDGSWRWSDGTEYRSNYKNWAFSEPNNWEGHEQGGTEDCAEILTDGHWNDNLCLQLNRWVCEKRRNITG